MSVRRRSMLFGVGLACAVGSSWPACDDPTLAALVAALGDECVLTSDCEEGLACVFGRCHEECEVTPDCRTLDLRPLCVLGDKPHHVCLLPDEQTCTTSLQEAGWLLYVHADCPPELRCGPDGLCRDRCTDRGDCLASQLCLKGVCVDPEGEELPADSPLLDDAPGAPSATCSYDSQCIQPLACIEGLCDVECQEDVDCPMGSRCVTITAEPLGPTRGCRVIGFDPDLPAHCSDFTLNESETDVDCGGACPPCAAGAQCSGPSDCNSGVCTSGACAVPSCQDDVENGFESDVDCGGPQCPDCALGQSCVGDADCAPPTLCRQGSCVAPSCQDGVLNGGETDVDCGAPSCPCPPGSDCAVGSNCESGICQSGICSAPQCPDGVRNGTETDVDCGGPGCPTCSVGATCGAGTDCASGVCDAGVCDLSTCDDGLVNGGESDADCGGPSCPPCSLGQLCGGDADCGPSAACVAAVCQAKPTLSVVRALSGQGVVWSAPAGLINCSPTATLCSATLAPGTSLTLYAAPLPGSSFAGFSGASCSTSPCAITLGSDVTVTASFP